MLAWLGIEFNLVSHLEKSISALGGLIGILTVLSISQYFIGHQEIPLIVASIGASTILLFAVPHGALSQPWPVLGGHFFSALIGVTCAQWFPHHLFISAGLAIALATIAMYYFRCIHPPGGATALTAVMGGPTIQSLGYQFIFTPVLLNVLVILLTAMLVNYFFPWRRYPASLMSPPRPSGQKHIVLSPHDLEYALKQMDSFIDVTEEDLSKIYTLAVEHAQDSSSKQSR